jgi:hypothetical protein
MLQQEAKTVTECLKISKNLSGWQFNDKESDSSVGDP